LGLGKLLGIPIPVGVDNLTWTLLKSVDSESSNLDAHDIETLMENYNKLKVAILILIFYTTRVTA
jgi:hypothetical protein